MDFDKDKAHMEALLALRELIDRDYREGGWLPPRSQMLPLLGISSSTYFKATARLVAEGILESHPKLGLHVPPERHRVKKFGVVFLDGQDSPFLGPLPELVAGVAQGAGDFHLQQIQGATVFKVFRSAVSHCVKGLVWAMPGKATLAELRGCLAEGFMPTVVALHGGMRDDCASLLEGVPNVSDDLLATGTAKTDFLIRRGHRQVLLVGVLTPELLAKYVERLRAGGVDFDAGCWLSPEDVKAGRLPELLAARKPTAISVDGLDGESLELLFQHLSALPGDQRPELLVRSYPTLPRLHRNYPKVKVAGTVRGDEFKLGEMAAAALIRHLNTGEPLCSVQAPCLHISEGPELEAELSRPPSNGKE